MTTTSGSHQQISQALISLPQFQYNAFTRQNTVSANEGVLKTCFMNDYQQRDTQSQNYLRVYYNTKPSSFVKKVLAHMGFIQAPNVESADLIWTKPDTLLIRKLLPSQFSNHIAGSHWLTVSENFYKLVKSLENINKDYNFLLTTVFISETNEVIVKDMQKAGDICVDVTNKKVLQTNDFLSSGIIVQKAFKLPLLYNEKKFYIKTYVLINNLRPLTIYTSSDSLAIVCEQKFDAKLLSSANYFAKPQENNTILLNQVEQNLNLNLTSQVNKVVRLSFQAVQQYMVNELNNKIGCQQFGLFEVTSFFNQDKQCLIDNIQYLTKLNSDLELENKAVQQFLVDSFQTIGFQKSNAQYQNFLDNSIIQQIEKERAAILKQRDAEKEKKRELQKKQEEKQMEKEMQMKKQQNGEIDYYSNGIVQQQQVQQQQQQQQLSEEDRIKQIIYNQMEHKYVFDPYSQQYYDEQNNVLTYEQAAFLQQEEEQIFKQLLQKYNEEQELIKLQNKQEGKQQQKLEEKKNLSEQEKHAKDQLEAEIMNKKPINVDKKLELYDKEKLMNDNDEEMQEDEENKGQKGKKSDLFLQNYVSKKLSDQEKMKLLCENKLYDFQIYSHLINELKVNGKYVKLNYNKLSEYEKYSLNKLKDEEQRCGSLSRIFPSKNVQEVNVKGIARFYMNELISCCWNQESTNIEQTNE